MLTKKEQSLLDALEPKAHDQGYEIVTVEVTGASKSPVIRVYLDAEGGVTFDVLTSAQAWIGEMLDEIDPFPGAYVLEVSSPGIDRPLRTIEHFKAAVGEKAKIKTAHAREGRKHFKGVITSVEDDSVIIDADGQQIVLPYQDISKANVIGTVEF